MPPGCRGGWPRWDGNVHKIQPAYKLTPLSAWGKEDYVPPKEPKWPLKWRNPTV